MSYDGHIENGVVVLEGGVSLPEGMTVRVEPVTVPDDAPESDSIPSLYDRLRGLVGAARGLPSDLAERHDYYLHGVKSEG